MTEQVLKDFSRVRAYSIELCAPLEIEDFVVQPLADVSPPKWHLGHTTWFFEELLLVPFLNGYQRFDESFGTLFNSYYKAAGEHWLQAQRGNLSRPTVARVYAYRDSINAAVKALLQQQDQLTSLDRQTLFERLEIGLHHEQQHQELLLMDIKVILSSNPALPAYHQAPLALAKKQQRRWQTLPQGLAEIGHDGEGFSYDNEKPRHKVYIAPTQVCDSLVSNGEYLAFMQDGAYTQATLWLSAAWDWLNAEAITKPLYWYQQEGQWYEYTLHGTQPLDLHAPLMHISYFEADAYARWAQCRLPTEAELELYLEQANKQAAVHEQKNEGYHATDIKAAHTLWCWTQSHYSPYPGFKAFAGMLEEYNGKFMCEQFVLRGGCVATPAGHYRHSYRNFFNARQRWMFSGLRLARDNT